MPNIELKRNGHFKFSCAECGKCCHNFESCITSHDFFRISKHLRIEPLELYRKHFVASRFAHSNLAFASLDCANGACPFLAGTSCSIYNARPYICRIYPVLYRPQPKRKGLLYDLNLACSHIGQGNRVFLTRWLKAISPRDHRTLNAFHDLIIKITHLETAISDKVSAETLQYLYGNIFAAMYLNYDWDEDFEKQFKSNSAIAVGDMEHVAFRGYLPDREW